MPRLRRRKSDGWNSASFKPDVSEWLKRESQEQELSISRKVTCDENVPMKSIDEHIQKDKTDIEAAKAAGDDAKVRHLEVSSTRSRSTRSTTQTTSTTPHPWSCIAMPTLTLTSAASTTTEVFEIGS